MHEQVLVRERHRRAVFEPQSVLGGKSRHVVVVAAVAMPAR